MYSSCPSMTMTSMTSPSMTGPHKYHKYYLFAHMDSELYYLISFKLNDFVHTYIFTFEFELNFLQKSQVLILIYEECNSWSLSSIYIYCYEFTPARRAISRSTRMATESPTGRTIQSWPFWDYREKPVTGGDLTPPLPSPRTIRAGRVNRPTSIYL